MSTPKPSPPEVIDLATLLPVVKEDSPVIKEGSPVVKIEPTKPPPEIIDLAMPLPVIKEDLPIVKIEPNKLPLEIVDLAKLSPHIKIESTKPLLEVLPQLALLMKHNAPPQQHCYHPMHYPYQYPPP